MFEVPYFTSPGWGFFEPVSARSEIVNSPLKLILRVEHERTVVGDRLVQGFASQKQDSGGV